MSNSAKDASVADVAADLAALRADIAKLSDTVAGLVRMQTDAAGEAIRNVADGAKAQFTQAALDAQESAYGAAADLERRIEKYPLTSVLIAAGVGMALGMMSKSR